MTICNFFLRLQVLMVVSMKMAVFWIAVLYSIVEAYQCFRGAYCFNNWPDDGGNKHPSNVGKLIQSTWHKNPEKSHIVAMLFDRQQS
jgi:hypothetical protein